MVVSPLPTFLALLLIEYSARAQINAPNCSDPSMAWSFNSLSQGPCMVAAFLMAVCSNGAFSIPALSSQRSYTGPSGEDNGDLCKCNTVTYNLISACDACQGEAWIVYSQWTTNCTSVVAPGTFSEPIPVGTRVPNWAYLDPTPDNSWNESAAQLAGDSPEVTGSASIFPTSTKNSQSTFTPQTTSSVSSNPSSSSHRRNSDIGAIAGGTAGGIAMAALIAGIVSWFTIRRRRVRFAEVAVTYPPPMIETPKLYDPSDPTTYPTQPLTLIAHTRTNNREKIHPARSESDLQPNRQCQAYYGLPEV